VTDLMYGFQDGLCTEYSIRILFGPNSRPNSVFVFGRIVMLKTGRIRIISNGSPLVVLAFSFKTVAVSAALRRWKRYDALWHFLNCLVSSVSSVCFKSLLCFVAVSSFVSGIHLAWIQIAKCF